ncbi:MAG: ribonuclease E/G, partial [Caulobacteraceae bacterium]
TLGGKPERLWIERDGEAASPALGARYAARVARIEPALKMAFLDLGPDLGGGAEALLPLGQRPPVEGAPIEVEIVAESRRGKLAVAQFAGAGTRDPGLILPAPTAAQRLTALAKGAPVIEGEDARATADEAEEAVLAVEHAITGGGSLAVERTRALVAVDVDLGARPSGDPARIARNANAAAIGEAARLLRLKGLGGLIVVDLVGRGQDGEMLAAAAKRAFEPDQPGVALGPISRFGTLTLALPWRVTPLAERLLDANGASTARTEAQWLVRALEHEGRSDPGGLFMAECAEEVAAELAPLVTQLGPRYSVVPSNLPRNAGRVRPR